MELLKFISNAGQLLLLLNVILYFTGFGRNGKACKIFSVYLLGICIIQVLMEILALHKYNNHFLSGYYLFVQFVLLSWFFHQLFLPINARKSAFVKYTSVVVLLGLVIQYCSMPGLYRVFNSIGFLITALVLIGYAVLYLYEMLTRKPLFLYAVVGVFIYLISSALIFASAAAIVNLKDVLYVDIWIVNAVLFILYQLLILWEWKQQFSPMAAKRA